MMANGAARQIKLIFLLYFIPLLRIFVQKVKIFTRNFIENALYVGFLTNVHLF